MDRKYIDSNIFLNAILYKDTKAKKCREILSQLIDNKFIGVTSLLTWDEIVYVVSKNLGREIAFFEGEKFLKFPNLIFVDTDKNVILKSQKFLGKYNLMPRDSIHLASAVLSGCGFLISDDSDFDKVNEIKRVNVG